jgi:hypothetical protein
MNNQHHQQPKESLTSNETDEHLNNEMSTLTADLATALQTEIEASTTAPLPHSSPQAPEPEPADDDIDDDDAASLKSHIDQIDRACAHKKERVSKLKLKKKAKAMSTGPSQARLDRYPFMKEHVKRATQLHQQAATRDKAKKTRPPPPVERRLDGLFENAKFAEQLAATTTTTMPVRAAVQVQKSLSTREIRLYLWPQERQIYWLLPAEAQVTITSAIYNTRDLAHKVQAPFARIDFLNASRRIIQHYIHHLPEAKIAEIFKSESLDEQPGAELMDCVTRTPSRSPNRPPNCSPISDDDTTDDSFSSFISDNDDALSPGPPTPPVNIDMLNMTPRAGYQHLRNNAARELPSLAQQRKLATIQNTQLGYMFTTTMSQDLEKGRCLRTTTTVPAGTTILYLGRFYIDEDAAIDDRADSTYLVATEWFLPHVQGGAITDQLAIYANSIPSHEATTSPAQLTWLDHDDIPLRCGNMDIQHMRSQHGQPAIVFTDDAPPGTEIEIDYGGFYPRELIDGCDDLDDDIAQIKYHDDHRTDGIRLHHHLRHRCAPHREVLATYPFLEAWRRISYSPRFSLPRTLAYRRSRMATLRTAWQGFMHSTARARHSNNCARLLAADFAWRRIAEPYMMWTWYTRIRTMCHQSRTNKTLNLFAMWRARVREDSRAADSR